MRTEKFLVRPVTDPGEMPVPQPTGPVNLYFQELLADQKVATDKRKAAPAYFYTTTSQASFITPQTNYSASCEEQPLGGNSRSGCSLQVQL